MTEIMQLSVTFELPEWTKKYDYYKRHHYDESHQWAGQVKSETAENEVMDLLWEEMKWEESCAWPGCYWVKFFLPTDPSEAIVAIQRLQMSLEEHLAHFRGGRRKPHGNVY